MSYIQHIVLYSDVSATDGLDDTPINIVNVVGVAGDEESAMERVAAHFEQANADGFIARNFTDHSRTLVPNPEDDARRDANNQLWFLRGAGTKGDEIHAGYGRTTLYRIVQVAS